MLLKIACLSLIAGMSLFANNSTATTSTSIKNPTINYQGKVLEVKQISEDSGTLSDGTKVSLTCIRKGMMGMPNISMPSYRGNFTNDAGDRCYVFVQE